MIDDPFTALGVPPRFDLDEADLHRRFIQASAANHPDRYIDLLDQADAAARSAAINEAYRLLKDPESRANALLIRLGGPAKEDDKSLPPDLLAEMMDVRERMEEAIASADKAALDELRGWAREQRRTRLELIAALFAKPQAAMKEVRLQLNALRYVERMIEQMPE